MSEIPEMGDNFVDKATAWDSLNASYRRGMEHGLALVPKWNRVVDGQEPNGLVLLVMALFETGEQMGYDLGWFEDGDWMYARYEGDPNPNIYPTHWCAIPDLPGV